MSRETPSMMRPMSSVFQMADGVWKSAATLGAGLTPQVALDAQGNGVVAWLNGTSLWGAATGSGNGFQTPDDLAIGENVYQMKLATTGVQNAVAVWIEGARLRSSRLHQLGLDDGRTTVNTAPRSLPSRRVVPRPCSTRSSTTRRTRSGPAAHPPVRVSSRSTTRSASRLNA